MEDIEMRIEENGSWSVIGLPDDIGIKIKKCDDGAIYILISKDIKEDEKEVVKL